MRFVIERVALRDWLWHLFWDDVPVADSQESYESEAAAEAAARAFGRQVKAAAWAVRV